MHLHLIGFHVAQPNLDAMAAAMMRANPSQRVIGTAILHGQGGASYEALVREARTWTVSARAWDGLLSRYDAHPTPPDAYSIVCWSAGYGALRELLRQDEGLPVDVIAVAALDSIYGTRAPSGGPVPEELALWSGLAEQAIAGGIACAIGASDIDYMERAPTPPAAQYLSTGTMARAIVRACGQVLTDAPTRTRANAPTAELEAGGLLVQLHDVGPGVGAAEHVAAVLPSGWGVEMMAWLATHLPGSDAALRELGGSRDGDGASRRGPPVDTSSPSATASELTPGARGSVVIDMQRTIGATPDGTWGPLTTAALARWQVVRNIPVRAAWGAAERAVAERVGAARVVRGVDVSRSQGAGEGNAWEKWGCSFGFARCSSGAKVDETFAANWRQMGAAGLALRGSYHYVNGRPASEQMGAFLDAWRAVNGGFGPPPGHLIAIDIEPWNGNAHDPAWIAAMSSGVCEELVARLQALGARVGIYGARWALECVPGLSSRLHALDVWWWIADASGAALAAGHPVLGLPRGVQLSEVKFWQMGSRTAVGEPAPIDDDRWLGTLDELKAFAAG